MSAPSPALISRREKVRWTSSIATEILRTLRGSFLMNFALSTEGRVSSMHIGAHIGVSNSQILRQVASGAHCVDGSVALQFAPAASCCGALMVTVGDEPTCPVSSVNVS